MKDLILLASLCGLPVAQALCAGSGFAQQILPNGVLENGEQCDDGNTIPGDGCNQYCETENLIFVAVDDELAIQCFHPADTGALVADVTRDADAANADSSALRSMAVPRGFTNLMFGRTLETMQVKGQGAFGSDGTLTAQPASGNFLIPDQAGERVGSVFDNDHGYEALDPFGDRCYLVDYMEVPSRYLNAGAALDAAHGFELGAQVRSAFYPGEEFPDIVWHPHFNEDGTAIAQDPASGGEQFYSVQNCRQHLLDWRPKSVTTQFPLINGRDATAVYPASQSHERLLHHFHDAYLTERCPQTPALDQRYQPESEAQLPEWSASYLTSPPLRHHGFGESYRAFLAADRLGGANALGGSGEPVDARLFQPVSQSVGFWEGCAVWTTPGADTFLTFDVSGMFIDSENQNRWATMFLIWDDPDDAADNCPAMVDISLQQNTNPNVIPSCEGAWTADAGDDANEPLGTGSLSARKYPICGDGFVDWPFESCEPGTGNTPQLEAFGAGVAVNGNNIPVGSTCTAWCTQEVADGGATCGNGIVEGDEVCDAGEAGFDGYPHHDWARVWTGVGTFNIPATWPTASCDTLGATAGACAAGPVYSAVLGCSGTNGGDSATQCMPQYAWAPGPDAATTPGGVKGATRFTGSRIQNLETKAGTASGSETANIRGDGSPHRRAVQRFEWRVPGGAKLHNDLFSPWRQPLHRILQDPLTVGANPVISAGNPLLRGAAPQEFGSTASGDVTSNFFNPLGPELGQSYATAFALVGPAPEAFGTNPLYGAPFAAGDSFYPRLLWYGSVPETGDFPDGPIDTSPPSITNPGLGIRGEANVFRFDDLSRWSFDPVQACIFAGACAAPGSRDFSGVASFYGTNYFVQTPRAYKVLNAPAAGTAADGDRVDSSAFFSRSMKNRDFPTPWYAMCLMNQRREAAPTGSSAQFESVSDRRVFKVSPWKVQPERGCNVGGQACGFIPDEDALITAADNLLQTVTPLLAIDPATGYQHVLQADVETQIVNPALYASNPTAATLSDINAVTFANNFPGSAFGNLLDDAEDDWREAGLFSKAPAYGDRRAYNAGTGIGLSLDNGAVLPDNVLWLNAVTAGVGGANFWSPFSWVLTQYKQRNLMVFQLRDPVYRAELAQRSQCAGVGFSASGANPRSGGKCINPRREAMCGKNVYRLGVEQCCNVQRSLVRRINFETFTDDNNAPRRESGCPCINDNRVGHFRWWTIDQTIGCPAGEACCTGNQNSNDSSNSIDIDSGRIEVGRCHSTATSRCCDTGCIYNPVAEQCCAIGQSYGVSRDMAQSLLVGLQGLGVDAALARAGGQAGTVKANGVSDLVIALYRILNPFQNGAVDASEAAAQFSDPGVNAAPLAAGLLDAIVSSPRLSRNPGVQSIEEPCYCEDDTDCSHSPKSVCCFGANPWGGAGGAIPFLPEPYPHIPQCSRFSQYPLDFTSNFGFSATQRADFDFKDGKSGQGEYTTARAAQLVGGPFDPRRVENLHGWRQAMLPLSCRGKCIDTRYQMCCQGSICSVEYQSCCNSTCCNRFSETCVTRRKSQSIGDASDAYSADQMPSFNDWFPARVSSYFSEVFMGGRADILRGSPLRENNANGLHEEYDVCTEIEALDVLKSFYIFVLPTLLLIFSTAGFAITIIYANRITGRNFACVERVLVLIGAALVLLAMPIYFSPQYKYAAVATLLGLFTIFVAASRIRSTHGFLVLVYVVSVLYFIDPFSGNQLLSLNSERFFNRFNVGFVKNERTDDRHDANGNPAQRNPRDPTSSGVVSPHGSGLMASLTANFPMEWQFAAAGGLVPDGQRAVNGCLDAACTGCRDGYEWFRLPRVSVPTFAPDDAARFPSDAEWAAGATNRPGTSMAIPASDQTGWISTVNLVNWIWPSVPDNRLTTRAWTVGTTGNRNTQEINLGSPEANRPYLSEIDLAGAEATPSGICVQKRCTEFYLGFFQKDTKRAYDFARVDNLHETRFGFCSRGWITALLVFGGLVVLLVLLGLAAAVFALLPRERPTEGIDLVIKDAYPVADAYHGNERFNE